MFSWSTRIDPSGRVKSEAGSAGPTETVSLFGVEIENVLYESLVLKVGVIEVRFHPFWCHFVLTLGSEGTWTVPDQLCEVSD